MAWVACRGRAQALGVGGVAAWLVGTAWAEGAGPAVAEQGGGGSLARAAARCGQGGALLLPVPRRQPVGHAPLLPVPRRQLNLETERPHIVHVEAASAVETHFK